MINVWRSLRFTVVFAILLGLLYPLAITGVGNLLFPFQAQGSMLQSRGQVVGSLLIAQATPDRGLFQPRPSAVNYAANDSGGSNLGPTNPALIAEVRANLQSVERANPGVTAAQIPTSMVESSGSGLDPDVSVTDARLQVARIARYTHLSTAFLYDLIERDTVGRTLGIWGEPMVNVQQLNEGIWQAEGRAIGDLR